MDGIGATPWFDFAGKHGIAVAAVGGAVAEVELGELKQWSNVTIFAKIVGAANASVTFTLQASPDDGIVRVFVLPDSDRIINLERLSDPPPTALEARAADLLRERFGAIPEGEHPFAARQGAAASAELHDAGRRGPASAITRLDRPPSHPSQGASA